MELNLFRFLEFLQETTGKIKMIKKKVLILGVSGMIGSTIFKYFSSHSELEVFGTARSEKSKNYFHSRYKSHSTKERTSM